MLRKVTGEEALALGAWQAGVRFVTGYPGTPSKGIFTALQNLNSSLIPHPSSLSFHWATDEKVALELAVGATLAGLPSLVCVKSVGANVLLDALMTVNLSGVPVPLVIALGDDPSAWTSQNEQDSRWLTLMSELPMLEPTKVGNAHKLIHAAFQLSADFALPIIVRFPKAFTTAEGELEEEPSSLSPVRVPEREPLPSIASGGNAIRLHAELHEKMRRIEQAWNDSPFNEGGDGWRVTSARQPSPLIHPSSPIPHLSFVVLAVGFCATKVRQVLDAVGAKHASPLQISLATTHPLPRRWLTGQISGKSVVLVLEEGEPIVETQVKAMAHEFRLNCAVKGKLTGELPQEGELTLRCIGKALRNFTEISADAVDALPDPERPQGFSLRFCEGCPYPPFLDALTEACKALGVEPVVAADPGCAIVALGKPYELVHIKHSMGGSVNFIAALAKLERNPKRRYIALVGDSDFFHGAVTGILNAAYWRAPMAIAVLDNSGAAFTGGQPHPGSGFDAQGEFVPPMKMEAILEAAGIPTKVVSSRDADGIRQATHWVLSYGDGLRALIVREPCPFVPIWTTDGLKPQKTEGKVVGE